MVEQSLAGSILAFRNLLIRKTVTQAVAHSEFYRSLHGKFAHEIHTVSDLPLLPVTTKSLFRAQNIADVLTSNVTPFITQHTSGTTDKPFYVYRGENEVRFIQQFFCDHADAFEKEKISISAFQPNYHGGGIPVPAPSRYQNFNVIDGIQSENEIDKAITSLSREGSSPTVITGIFQHIRYLTTRLVEKGFDFERAPIAGIYVTGQYVSERWRKLLSSLWGVEVTPRFSLTEGFGGALYCTRCEGYHFDQFCVPEVLSIETGQQVEYGTGLLHLTSLFPFVQMMPFIRYRTGDIVEVFPSECSMQVGKSVKFLGRIDHAQIICSKSRKNLIVPASVFSDILEKYPLVNTGNSSETPLLAGCGSSCFRLRRVSTLPERLIVETELRVEPWIWSREVEHLRSNLLSDFRLAAPELAIALSEYGIELSFNFLPRGSLGPLEPGGLPETFEREISCNE